MKNFKITSDFNSAVAMASEILGYPMFECYENVQAEKAKRHEKYGTEKFYVTESGKILWVFNYEGERVLNITTGPSGSCLSAGSLGLVMIQDDSIDVIMEEFVAKDDRATRIHAMRSLESKFVFADRDVLREIAA